MNDNYMMDALIICRAIGDVVNEKKAELTKNNSAKELENKISFLKAHNLITFFGFIVDEDECVSFLGDNNYKKLKSKVNQAMFRQLKNNTMCESISKLFFKKGIRHIILKGLQLQQFYPSKIVRTSNDIDIYIQDKDVKSAEKILLSEGFIPDKIYDNQEFCYKKEPRYYVELHINLDGFSEKQKGILKNIADNTLLNCGEKCFLSDNDCYVYTLFHLYKHFVQSGAGIRMFLDVYLVRKNATLNYDYIAPVLKELGIDKFEKAVTEINKCLFDGQEVPEKLNCVIEFICKSGTFGTKTDFRYLSKINSAVTNKSNFEKFKESYGIGFEAMKDRYPILEKCPFLYPFSFIHRFFYGILYKGEVIKKVQEEKADSKEFKVKYREIFEAINIGENMNEDV